MHCREKVIYESETHNGVGELLEILGSIINGWPGLFQYDCIHLQMVSNFNPFPTVSTYHSCTIPMSFVVFFTSELCLHGLQLVTDLLRLQSARFCSSSEGGAQGFLDQSTDSAAQGAWSQVPFATGSIPLPRVFLQVRLISLFLIETYHMT